MNTNMTGFRWLSKIFASLSFGQKYSLRIERVRGLNTQNVVLQLFKPSTGEFST